MKKVIVIGCPGSGKSTFARALRKKTELPLYYLDQMNWNADGTNVEKEVFLSRLTEALAQPEWIIDGNYASTIPLRLSHCDTVFFLDYPLEVCLDGLEKRRGTLREDMPWVESADKPDEEFISFVRNFEITTRLNILSRLEQHPNKHIVVFKSRNDADAYLKELGSF